jgi:hypothetical protein
MCTTSCPLHDMNFSAMITASQKEHHIIGFMDTFMVFDSVQ